MERFEKVCRTFTKASRQEQEAVLALMDDKEKRIFLEGVGFYKLFTDPGFYNEVQAELLKEYLKEVSR